VTSFGESPISTSLGQNGAVIELDEMLADLELLVNTESPSLEVELLEHSARVVADLLERRLGGSVQIIAGPVGPHVHWQGGGTPRVLIVGHHDTVFPVGTVAKRPFAVADGRATGPGVFDMKGGIVQLVHGVASLADRSGIEILITADEEVGSGSSREIIERRAIACGNVLVCEPSGDGGALKIARKGTGTFELVVHGRASHAGLEPEKGVNSLIAAAELVGKVLHFADPSKGTTVTPTMATAGTAENVVPAEARVIVDVRIEELDEGPRVQAAFDGLETSVPGARIEVLGGVNRPPMPASASERIFPTAVAAAEAAGLGPIRGVAVGNFTAARGVPTLDGLGAVGGGAHADHEFIEVATLVPRAQLIAAVVAAL
jgi:glutamate carboxypeptidase